MSPKEHAEVWRRAARVVADLDPRRSWMIAAQHYQGQLGHEGQMMGPSYTSEQAVAWEAYSTAASILSAIAAEYEKAEQSR